MEGSKTHTILQLELTSVPKQSNLTTAPMWKYRFGILLDKRVLDQLLEVTIEEVSVHFYAMTSPVGKPSIIWSNGLRTWEIMHILKWLFCSWETKMILRWSVRSAPLKDKNLQINIISYSLRPVPKPPIMYNKPSSNLQ